MSNLEPPVVIEVIVNPAIEVVEVGNIGGPPGPTGPEGPMGPAGPAAGGDQYVEILDSDTSDFGFVIDEDNMVSDSDTKVPTQQSVKAYADLRWTSWVGTGEEYAALGTYDDDTLYVIPGTPPDVWHRWSGTQAEYDALGTYEDDTLYVIVEEP